MKKMYKQMIVGLIFFSTIISFFLYRYYKKEEIRKCHYFTVGKIICIGCNAKNRGVNYEYFVNGKRYAHIGKLYAETLPIKTIPVLYPCSDPSFGQLMLTPEEYDLPYPDSLQWVNKYIEKHK